MRYCAILRTLIRFLFYALRAIFRVFGFYRPLIFSTTYSDWVPIRNLAPHIPRPELT